MGPPLAAEPQVGSQLAEPAFGEEYEARRAAEEIGDLDAGVLGRDRQRGGALDDVACAFAVRFAGVEGERAHEWLEHGRAFSVAEELEHARAGGRGELDDRRRTIVD